MLFLTLYISYQYMVPTFSFLFYSQKDSIELRNQLMMQSGVKEHEGFIDENLTIKDIIEDTELQLISWDINQRAPRFYTKFAYDTIGEEGNMTLSLLNMTWANAATVMYFTPAHIQDSFYISGDNVAKSPAMFSYLYYYQ